MILNPLPPTAKEAARKFGQWMREHRIRLGIDQESAARRTIVDHTPIISSSKWRRLEGSTSAHRQSAPSPKELYAIAVLALGRTVKEALQASGHNLDDSENPAVGPPD